MNVKIKTFIIWLAIAIFISSGITFGISFYIYTRASKKYEDDVKLANARADELVKQLEKSSKTADRLTDFNRKLIDANTKDSGSVEKITDLNKGVRDILDKGSSQK